VLLHKESEEKGNIAPEHTEVLMICSGQYANYRVIMGRYWKSDVDAGRTLAITIFLKEVINLEYLQQLLKGKSRV
jgi:hypothetical protein